MLLAKKWDKLRMINLDNPRMQILYLRLGMAFTLFNSFCKMIFFNNIFFNQIFSLSIDGFNINRRRTDRFVGIVPSNLQAIVHQNTCRLPRKCGFPCAILKGILEGRSAKSCLSLRRYFFMSSEEASPMPHRQFALDPIYKFGLIVLDDHG